VKSFATVGNIEWAGLEDLNIPFIRSKIDTGASLCALHATNVTVSQRKDGTKMVSFNVSPLAEKRKLIRCKAPLHSLKNIQSSNGMIELRFVIETTIKLGNMTKKVLVTLVDRSKMEYRFLIGSQALKTLAVVDVDKEYVLGDQAMENVYSIYKIKKNIQPRKLNIALLASNPKLYSNQRIMEACRARGHEVTFINVSQCYLEVKQGNHFVMYEGKSLTDFDAVIPRIKPKLTFFGCSILSQLDVLGVYCVNESQAIKSSRDKLLAYQLMAQRDIPIPLTAFANSPKNTKDIIRSVGGAPLIIKILESTQGKGVILCNINKTAESSINAFKQLGANILIQEYIEESRGVDVRAFVIGRKVVAAIERRATDAEEYRSNVHLGGVAKKIKLTKEEKKMAVRAARCMGLEIAGVDLIHSNEGIKVLEVNSSPGLEGIEGATRKDIAGEMVEYIESKFV
jgi:ribosomal protein S6--L-glutamate ligase